MSRRNTTQRSIVLDVVEQSGTHITAEEIYSKIAGSYPHISRATVYRNLKWLADSGKIRKVEIPGEAGLYDRVRHQHYHAKCSVCGNVMDVDMDVIKDLDKQVRDAQDFEFTGHDIIFSGICRDCRRGKSNK